MERRPVAACPSYPPERRRAASFPDSAWKMHVSPDARWYKPSSGVLAEHVALRLTGYRPTGPPSPLPGGLLNLVWRLPCTPASVVIKLAPPFVAALPDIPLDPSRLRFEAAALRLLGGNGALRDVPDAEVRPPRLLDYDASSSILLLEDLGTLPPLDQSLSREGQGILQGRRLGRFVGRVHAATLDDCGVASALSNVAIQEARHRIQYCRVGDFLREAGVADADAVSRAAVGLGLRLMQPGRCMIMGDLWPPSVLVADDGLRVIDWELAHYGNPAQDLGHLAAHLWMLGHGPRPVAEALAMLGAFLAEYRETIGDRAGGLLTAEVRRDCALHFGAEVVMRAVGTFRSGSPHGRASRAEGSRGGHPAPSGTGLGAHVCGPGRRGRLRAGHIEDGHAPEGATRGPGPAGQHRQRELSGNRSGCAFR